MLGGKIGERQAILYLLGMNIMSVGILFEYPNQSGCGSDQFSSLFILHLFTHLIWNGQLHLIYNLYHCSGHSPEVFIL